MACLPELMLCSIYLWTHELPLGSDNKEINTPRCQCEYLGIIMRNLTPNLIFPPRTFKTGQVTWTQASTATLNYWEQAIISVCVSVCVCGCMHGHVSISTSYGVFSVCLCILGQRFSGVWKWALPSGFPHPLGGTLCPTWDQLTDVWLRVDGLKTASLCYCFAIKPSLYAC